MYGEGEKTPKKETIIRSRAKPFKKFKVQKTEIPHLVFFKIWGTSEIFDAFRLLRDFFVR